MPEELPVNRGKIFALAQAHMTRNPVIWMEGPVYVRLTEHDAIRFLAASVPLREFIDVDKLADADKLREAGIDPGAVRVALGPERYGTFSFPHLHLLVMTVRDATWKPYQIYLTIAHELEHHRQSLDEGIPDEVFLKELEDFKLHAERPSEIEGVRAELREADKLGITERQYNEYLYRMYPESYRVRTDLPEFLQQEAEDWRVKAVERSRRERHTRRAIGVPKARTVPVSSHTRRRPRV